MTSRRHNGRQESQVEREEPEAERQQQREGAAEDPERERRESGRFRKKQKVTRLRTAE